MGTSSIVPQCFPSDAQHCGRRRLPVLARPGHTDGSLGIHLLARPVLLLLHGVQYVFGILAAHAAGGLLPVSFRSGCSVAAVGVPVLPVAVPFPFGISVPVRTVVLLSGTVAVLLFVPVAILFRFIVPIPLLVLVLVPVSVLVLIPVIPAAVLLLLFEQLLDIRKVVFRFEVGRILPQRLFVTIGRLLQLLLREHAVTEV